MTATMLLGFVLVLVGLLLVAPRWLGVDPLGRVVDWLDGGRSALGTRANLAYGEPLEDIGRELKDLGEHIEAVRCLAEERGTQIERLREGYDFSITRSFARGVIKTIDLIGDYQRQLEETHGDAASPVLKDALARLDATASQLTLLLEANQIESFHPEPRESIEEDSRRYKPVEKRPTDRVEDCGRVAGVVYPGWVLVLGDSQERVIREAQVSVFSPREEGSSPR